MSVANNPNYRVLLPVWEGGEPCFELTPQQSKTILGGRPHRVAPVDKSQRAHEQASSCESILEIYPHAISVGGVMGCADVRGYVGFGGLMGVSMMIFLSWIIFKIGLCNISSSIMFSAGIVAISIPSIYFLKSGYLLPKDQPILFNKKNKLITYSQVCFHPFWKFWIMPRFNPPVTVPWETVQARSYKFTQDMGETLRDSYRLEIWAPRSDDPKKLLVKEPIGYLGWYEDAVLWQLYEHIRRYMEEDGPAILPDEHLRRPRRGRDLPPFPQEILDQLGGPALTDEQIEALQAQMTQQPDQRQRQQAQAQQG